MPYESVLSSLCDVFSKVLNIEREQICAQTKLTGEVGANSLHMDSLEFVKVIIAIEDLFQIVVDFEVYFDTIADFAHYVSAEIDAIK